MVETCPVPLQKGHIAVRLVGSVSEGTRTTTKRRGRTDFQPRPRHDLHVVALLLSMRPTIPIRFPETHSSSG